MASDLKPSNCKLTIACWQLTEGRNSQNRLHNKTLISCRRRSEAEKDEIKNLSQHLSRIYYWGKQEDSRSLMWWTLFNIRAVNTSGSRLREEKIVRNLFAMEVMYLLFALNLSAPTRRNNKQLWVSLQRRQKLIRGWQGRNFCQTSFDRQVKRLNRIRPRQSLKVKDGGETFERKKFRFCVWKIWPLCKITAAKENRLLAVINDAHGFR